MKLKKLTLENFMIYKKAVVEFTDSKIMNIYGIDLDRNTSNGIGKSALKEAILFALYGKTKVNLGDLIRKGASSCKVILTFEIDEKRIDVIRTFRNTSKLTVKINGEEVDFSKIKQKKKYIEELIGMDYDTCVNFSIFDAVRFEDLSSLSSSEIKRLLQLLFNYDKFSETYAKLRDTLRTNDNLLRQLQNRNMHYYSTKRVQILKSGLADLNKKKQDINKKIEILNNLKYSLIQDIASKNTIIRRNTGKINWLMSKKNCPECGEPLANKKMSILNKYQVEINQCKKEVEEKEVKIKNCERFLETYSQELVKFSNDQIRLNTLVTKLDIAKRNLLDMKEVERRVNKYKLATEVMKKFESYVMEYYMNYLEKVINEYLSKLIDIECKLSFIKQGSLLTRNIDKFYMKLYRSYNLKDMLHHGLPQKHEFSYMSLSSGERMLVAYAFKLAINILNFKDTFLFIDEGFNRLDRNNRKKLIQMLQESPFNQIFLISHDDKFEGIPVIYIEKKNDESSIQVKV